MRLLKTLGMAFVLLALVAPVMGQNEDRSGTVNQVEITATLRTYVLDAPRSNAELVGILQSGVEATALGRDAEGQWLRIMKGWVLGEVFNTVGEIGALPDATQSFLGSTTANNFLYDGPSARWFNSLAGIGEDTEILIIGRNEVSTWLQVPGGWVDAEIVETGGDISLLPVAPSGVIITANARTFILAEPDLSAEFVDVFEAGEEALATGRFGDWLQITQGWVSDEAVDASGDVTGLPYAGDGIPVTYNGNSFLNVRSQPEFLNVSFVRRLTGGETDHAVGRTADARFLYLGDGWVLTSSVQIEGDISSLAVTDGTSSDFALGGTSRSRDKEQTSTTQAPLNSNTIRPLVSRHTDDIRILDIKTASNSTTIEYDLKPWPFVPNESIANEVAFKIICAIRNGQQIPNTLKFIGHSHFKNDVGRKFTAKSVEMHISANNANRIVCRGNDPSDINWRRLASVYKSYPIPRGAKIDHG